MSFVAVAIGGSALVGAGASIAAGSAAAKAQKNASKQATDVQLAQNEEAKRQYDQNRTDLAPYRNVGNSALYSLGNLMGLDTGPAGSGGSTDWGAYVRGNPDALANWNAIQGTPAASQFKDINDFGEYHYGKDGSQRDLKPYTSGGNTGDPTEKGLLTKNFSLADFNADPGYQFRQDEGKRAVESGAAARGGILSGGTLKALERYSQGVASDEYGAAYNRFNTDQDKRYNRLASLAGVGQTATNTGIASGNALTGQLQEGANNITSNINAAGNARASQYANVGNAVSGVANSVGSYFALKDLYKTPPATGAWNAGMPGTST